MRRQSVRIIALLLGVTLAAAAPARAGTITFADVVSAIGASGQFRTASEVRLASQSGRAVVQQSASKQSVTAPSSQPQQIATGSTQQQVAQGGAMQGPASSDPTLSQSGGQVETVDLGDVTGTVCDCGEIPRAPLPKGAFPWWALAAVPLVCVSGICTSDNPETPTPPTTPPTPPQVPEPMSLLLFGSGLLAVGAGARRRHGRKQLEAEMTVATTEEV